MALCLRVRFRTPDGSIPGERVTYTLPVRLGRNPVNDCQLDHRFVSEFHCVIDLVDGQLCVRDMNSKNGVFSPTAARLPPGQAVPLASLGNKFIVGAAVEVTVETFEQKIDLGQRVSSFNGSILGNRAALYAGGSLPAPPPVQPWGSQSLPGLPPLSFAAPSGAPAPQGPPVRPPSFVPPAGDVPPIGSMSQSLPALPPLPGAFSVNGPQAAQPAHRPSAPAEAPAGVSRNTQYLSMSTETLALAGLRELAASLVPGVPLETTGDIARLLTKLHNLVEVWCRCFVVLREGYAQFVSSTGLAEPGSRRFNRSESAQRVEAARDPSTLAAALLDWRNRDFDAPKVLESALIDIVMHHAALVEGVMRGVDTLLEELSPAALEQDVQENGGMSAVVGRHKALWRQYEERFNSVASETHRFEVVFGPEFAASYREYRARQAKSLPP